MRAYFVFHKKSFFLFILLNGLIISSCFSQVGIGTTEPHASSMLEVESDSKGILIPRMTTAQRMAITSPANSLLVYDLDARLYYYFDSTTATWVPINSAISQTRNNYKLVKTVADLAPELMAGGGNSYVLTSNTHYEINGTINLTAPINLNNASLVGLDANEDVLIRSGGTIFTGSAGGTIKNLTLKAPGGTVFNLTNGTGQMLIFRDAIVAESGSVGIISGYGLVFSSVINYFGNAAGITYTNIGQLLLSNQAWSGSNVGTYETFTGTFDLIEKQGGFSQVNGSNVGINSTGVTTISGAAVIESTVFYGTSSTYVVGTSPYSGYNFNKNWFVESPGIPVEKDGATSGSYFMTNNTTETTINSANTPLKIQGITTAANLFRTGTGGLNNRLVYLGSKSRNFEVTVTGTVTPNVNNAIHIYYIYKNGQPVPSITAERRYYSNDVGNFTLTGIVNLASGDYIEVFMQSDGTANPTVNRMNVILK